MHYIVLYDGYTVSAAFYNSVCHQVEEIIPAMEPDMRYPLKVLCGKAFWQPLSDGEKRMAGRCMAQMVVGGLLPLRFAEGRHEYPKLYRLP
jgi:hypothetical protein